MANRVEYGLKSGRDMYRNVRRGDLLVYTNQWKRDEVLLVVQVDTEDLMLISLIDGNRQINHKFKDKFYTEAEFIEEFLKVSYEGSVYTNSRIIDKDKYNIFLEEI